MTINVNEAGFLIDPRDWSREVMQELADAQNITLTEEMIEMVVEVREMYNENQVVPPLRVFSKATGGDRKGTHLNQMFSGGPMKKLALIAGLPQPTGCV